MRAQKGIALMMVIWVLALLMVLAASFSISAKTASLSAFGFREEAKESFLAEAGVEYGIMKTLHGYAFPESPEKWKTDGTSYGKEIRGGRFTVCVLDESGKVDINNSPPVILMGLLERAGLLPEDVETIMDSVMDWRDADDLHRLNGAEDDYYGSLPVPRRAKNADFDSVEELLLVRGMTREILYGEGGRKGLFGFLTVHSEDGKINVNAAPRQVLTATPGISEDTADLIIEHRKDKDLGMMELKALSGGSFELMEEYVKTDGEDVFTVESRGFSESGGFGVKAIFRRLGTAEYEFLYWKDRV